MKQCLECKEIAKLTDIVVDGVQIYECPNGHRWGIMPGTDEKDLRKEMEEAA